MIDALLIRKLPTGSVASNNGSKRLWCDYRCLNKKVMMVNFMSSKCCRVLATLDRGNGCFHVPIEEGSRKKISFVLSRRTYKRHCCSVQGLVSNVTVAP